MPDLRYYSEILFIPNWYNNPLPTICLPMPLFMNTNNTTKRLFLMNNQINVYYLNYTTINVLDTLGTYDLLKVYVR